MNESPTHGHLPRLSPEHYRGLAVVHWVMTVHGRTIGWLTPQFHVQCREALLHTMVRYSLLSPCYCLMPDHAHFVWMGVDDTADLTLAAEFFRRQTNLLLAPMRSAKGALRSCLARKRTQTRGLRRRVPIRFRESGAQGIGRKMAGVGFFGCDSAGVSRCRSAKGRFLGRVLEDLQSEGRSFRALMSAATRRNSAACATSAPARRGWRGSLSPAGS